MALRSGCNRMRPSDPIANGLSFHMSTRQARRLRTCTFYEQWEAGRLPMRFESFQVHAESGGGSDWAPGPPRRQTGKLSGQAMPSGESGTPCAARLGQGCMHCLHCMHCMHCRPPPPAEYYIVLNTHCGFGSDVIVNTAEGMSCSVDASHDAGFGRHLGTCHALVSCHSGCK